MQLQLLVGIRFEEWCQTISAFPPLDLIDHHIQLSTRGMSIGTWFSSFEKVEVVSQNHCNPRWLEFRPQNQGWHAWWMVLDYVSGSNDHCARPRLYKNLTVDFFFFLSALIPWGEVLSHHRNLLGVICCWAISFSFALMLQCIPVSQAWLPSAERTGHCYSPNGLEVKDALATFEHVCTCRLPLNVSKVSKISIVETGF